MLSETSSLDKETEIVMNTPITPEKVETKSQEINADGASPSTTARLNVRPLPLRTLDGSRLKKNFRNLTSCKPSGSVKGKGLASLVGSITKKEKKPSMLSKSAQDWRQFVHEEKLEEELSTHLKSRDSFLDRQDFLLRADYKQFEHERDLRAQERKNKQSQGSAQD